GRPAPQPVTDLFHALSLPVRAPGLLAANGVPDVNVMAVVPGCGDLPDNSQKDQHSDYYEHDFRGAFHPASPVIYLFCYSRRLVPIAAAISGSVSLTPSSSSLPGTLSVLGASLYVVHPQVQHL